MSDFDNNKLKDLLTGYKDGLEKFLSGLDDLKIPTREEQIREIYTRYICELGIVDDLFESDVEDITETAGEEKIPLRRRVTAILNTIKRYPEKKEELLRSILDSIPGLEETDKKVLLLSLMDTPADKLEEDIENIIDAFIK